MIILLIISIIIILLGLLFAIILYRRRKSFGVLEGKHVYKDTKEQPGYVITATTLPLSGKPDYLIEQDDFVIPVEYKSGKTPSSPFLNHTMQLMAYCFLVEEHFGKRPPGGVIKYPQKEFKVAYTKEAEESVRSLIAEMMEYKRSSKSFTCHHPDHNTNEFQSSVSVKPDIRKPIFDVMFIENLIDYFLRQVFATFHGPWKYEPDTKEIGFNRKFYDQAKIYGLTESDAKDVYFHGKSYERGSMMRKYNGYAIRILYTIAKDTGRPVITWIEKRERR